MRLKPCPSRVIVKLKGNFNDKLKGEEGSEFLLDVSYNPTHHIRTEAEVVGVPEKINSNVLTQVYSGSPAYKVHGNAPIKNLYHYQHKWLFTQDTDFDAIEGDVVYFHYNAIDWVNNYTENGRESFLGTDEDGFEYHQVDIETIFCRIRDGKIKMLNGKVLVTQLIEDTEEIQLIDGNTVQGTTSESGLILSLGEKPKYLEGIVQYIGEDVLCELTVLPQDRVMYLKNSEFANTIEGIEYYVMSQWDIVAKWISGGYKPIGAYVEIELIEEAGLTMPTTTTFRQKDGVITRKGNDCKGDYTIGNTVNFNPGSKRFVKYTENTIFVREEDIYFKYEEVI